jgi:hypothetical protein
MNNEPLSPADSTPAQDRATEALLREYARLKSRDDEPFLATFESRLAQEPACHRADRPTNDCIAEQAQTLLSDRSIRGSGVFARDGVVVCGLLIEESAVG